MFDRSSRVDALADRQSREERLLRVTRQRRRYGRCSFGYVSIGTRHGQARGTIKHHEYPDGPVQLTIAISVCDPSASVGRYYDGTGRFAGGGAGRSNSAHVDCLHEVQTRMCGYPLPPSLLLQCLYTSLIGSPRMDRLFAALSITCPKNQTDNVSL